jgi:hypothetical protein
VRAAYAVRAAVDVSIWDYFIYLSAEQANKSDGIWNHILSIYLQSILSICATCRPQYMYDVRRAAVHVRICNYFMYIVVYVRIWIILFIYLRSILSICMMCGLHTTCGPQYMSGFGITLSIYLEQANKLDGICNYFIYLSVEHFIYMYHVRAAV